MQDLVWFLSALSLIHPPCFATMITTQCGQDNPRNSDFVHFCYHHLVVLTNIPRFCWVGRWIACGPTLKAAFKISTKIWWLARKNTRILEHFAEWSFQYPASSTSIAEISIFMPLLCSLSVADPSIDLVFRFILTESVLSNYPLFCINQRVCAKHTSIYAWIKLRTYKFYLHSWQ